MRVQNNGGGRALGKTTLFLVKLIHADKGFYLAHIIILPIFPLDVLIAWEKVATQNLLRLRAGIRRLLAKTLVLSLSGDINDTIKFFPNSPLVAS